MKTKDQFSADMSKLFSLVNDCCGSDSIQSTIYGCLNGDIDITSDNEEDWVESFQYSDRGMFYVLYDLANYDLISLYGKKVNVKQSNHPDIATIVAKYAKPEAINRVYETLYD